MSISLRSMTKIAGSTDPGSWSESGYESGSGSINQRDGFADPDPHQNVMEPQHWSTVQYLADLIDVFCSGPGEAAGVVTADHVQRRGIRLAPCTHTHNTGTNEISCWEQYLYCRALRTRLTAIQLEDFPHIFTLVDFCHHTIPRFLQSYLRALYVYVGQKRPNCIDWILLSRQQLSSLIISPNHVWNVNKALVLEWWTLIEA